MQKIIVITILVFITGCNSETSEYKKFIETYGSNTRTFCKDGFKMQEIFKSPKAKAPAIFLLDSQECKI